MAKSGLTYYHVDTDRYQDKRIKKLKKSLGCVGLAVYDYILCESFRVNGWGMEWDDDVAFDIADYLNIKESVVTEVVKYCAHVGLLNARLLGCGIITSEEIQARYVEICKRSKRVSYNIPDKYRLYTEEMPKTTEDLAKTTEEMPIYTEDLTQNKIKENKIKENKREGDAHAHASTEVLEDNLFVKFLSWCETFAPLSLQFKEPLTESQFTNLHARYGAKKLKDCALDLHNKEACYSMRNAAITWDRWLKQIH